MLLNNGKEWLLHVLSGLTEVQRAMTLMTLWRIWHAHNEVTHGKPCRPVEGSRRFLVSYLSSLLLLKQFPEKDVEKGKMVISNTKGFSSNATTGNQVQHKHQVWERPEEEKTKLNVDGSYDLATGAGAGMVPRDQTGRVLYAACHHLPYCRDATEAELVAIEEGLRLAMCWTDLEFIVETDSAEALQLIKESTPNQSAYAFQVSVIRDLIWERGTRIAKIGRGANVVSHVLAKIGRAEKRTEVWFANFPLEVAKAASDDCNSTLI